MDIVYTSGVLSLIIQLTTGLFDFYVLQIKVPKEVMILKQVLILEFIVQIIEFSFYLWMVYNFDKLVNITPYRYWDWALTTPTMLISLCIYLLYLKSLEEKKVIEENLIQILSMGYEYIQSVLQSLLMAQLHRISSRDIQSILDELKCHLHENRNRDD